MAHLIIGHTTTDDVRIWLRGDSQHQTVSLVVTPEAAPGGSGNTGNGKDRVAAIELPESTDYTGSITVGNLTAGTKYAVTASFPQHPAQTVRGRFETFPSRTGNNPVAFSFVLSSCNLSVISINNFLALLLATGGTSAGMNSLELPVDRWRWPRGLWIRRIGKLILKLGLRVVVGLVKKATEIKQPGPPYLRSPFLKIAAVFRSMVLEIEAPPDRVPSVGTTLAWRDGCERAGTGVVACAATRIEDQAAEAANRQRYRVVLTQLEGKRFVAGAGIYAEGQGNEDGKDAGAGAIGRVTSAVDGVPWHEPPSFFLHAGDQIYYDFPKDDRPPALDEYRLAYREAWFDDDAHRYLLSHWSHYMTLDDHEIADQFARDFNPPTAPPESDQAKKDRASYLEQAGAAYREYARALGPSNGSPGPLVGGSFWYTFEKDHAAFFVMDLRTQRFNARGQMIDEEQMTQLLRWLTSDTRKDALKFVVTSVPFVAEIDDVASDAVPRWTSEQAGSSAAGTPSDHPPRNAANDKWCAERFTAQRERIIDCVAENGIEHVVFLTGDMHCCYHATMTIAPERARSDGENRKYRSLTIHELAAGPVNQLQLATLEEFNRRCTRQTASKRSYEVDLDRFHGDVNAVLHIRVAYERRARLVASDPDHVPVVEWNVIRTLTDGGADSWVSSPAPPAPVAPIEGRVLRAPISPGMAKGPVMTDRISFVRRREVADLLRW